jgi:glycosyltransferase involved in cell wall biosynthesis
MIVAEHPDRVQLEYAGYAWGRWGVAWWLNALLFALRRRKIPVHVGLHEVAIRMRQHPLQIPVALLQWAHIGLLLAAAETVALNMPARVELLGWLFPWWRGRLRYRPNSSTIAPAALAHGERAAFRRRQGAGDYDAVIATFGMFHTVKHYEALIEAVALLRAVDGPKLCPKLWMLGDHSMAAPSYVARLREMVRALGLEDCVWWSGRLEPQQVSLALQAADFFVLPQADGHLTRSSAFMAAAAHGLPVVAVRNSSSQIEFTHGKNICLVEHSAGNPIAVALRWLMENPLAARDMGRSLRRLYETRFSWCVAIGMPPAAEHASASSEQVPASARRETIPMVKAAR